MSDSKQLTDKHFCYILFLEMPPSDFINLMKINCILEDVIYLEPKDCVGLYQEAKELLLKKDLGDVSFDFDYDTEPFVFNKYVNGKLDRAYKICIFEHGVEKSYTGKTSSLYCDGMPLFFDHENNIIKTSLN